MPLKLTRNAGKSPNWYVRGAVTVWRDGEPRTITVERSTRTDCRTTAEGIKRQIENQVAERSINNKGPVPAFGQVAAQYLKAGGDDRFLDKPLDAFEHWPITDITQAEIDGEGRRAYPTAAPGTLRRQWHGPIAAVLKYHDPNRIIRRPKAPGRRTQFFRPAEAESVIAHAAGRIRTHKWAPALITFLIGTGARVSEALHIDARRDLYLDYGFAILRDTKNGDERRVTLIPRVAAALSTLPNLGKEGPLFRRPDGKPYAPRRHRGVRLRAFETAVEAAGLDPRLYTPHVCRHTWATWFHAATRDVVRLCDEGGWRSTEWTRYTKLASPHLAVDVAEHGWAFSDWSQRRSPAGGMTTGGDIEVQS